MTHASAALIKLCDQPYTVGSSYFIKVLLSKSYNFPSIAVDTLADYFFRFTDDSMLSLDDE